MTDPERFSRSSTGLAAELLRAGAEERPSERGVQQTLLALGLSAVVWSSSGAAGATAVVGSAKLTSALSASAGTGGVGLGTTGTVKAVSATLVIKWLGVGIVGGVGLMSAAAVATRPAMPDVVEPAAVPAPAHVPAARARTQPEPHPTVADAPPAPAASELAIAAVAPAPRVSAVATHAASALDAGNPLAAEVAYVDRARTLFAAGQAGQGLALLERYERSFPEARLLPEVLFLQLEGYERAGRGAEARRVAQRLVEAFPNGPHTGRARKLLGK